MQTIYSFNFGSLSGSFIRVTQRLCLALVLFVILPGLSLAQKKFIHLVSTNVSLIYVTPGKTVTITTDLPFSDLVVGRQGIADVIPLSDNSLYIQGNKNGHTNVSIFDEEKTLLGIIDVRVRLDFNELRQAIKSAVPSSKVLASNINNRIRLSGYVKDAVDLRKAIEIAEQYSSREVINSIRVLDAQQVNLKVRVLEVNRSAGRDLGINLAGVKAGNVKFVSGSSYGVSNRSVECCNLEATYDADGAGINGAPFGTLIGSLLEIAGTRIDIVINALEAKGLGRRLANPSLTAMSGTEASFLAGGEVPILTTSQGTNGSVASGITYREYGIRLRFLPIVLDNGLIHLEVNPEVSDIDRSVTVNQNPGFVTRKATTTVELRDGQSFAIAGLLQTTNQREFKQLPWLGQIPVLGALFRSTTFQKKESDLVIVVTPRIVRPAAPDEVLFSPLDQTRSSDDVELYLLGLLEVDKDMIRGFHNGKGVVGPYGHIIDLELKDQYVVKK